MPDQSNKFHKNLLKYWVLGTLIIFLLFIFQSINGHFQTNNLYKVGLWFALASLPALVFLFMTTVKHNYLRKEVDSERYMGNFFKIYLFMIISLALLHGVFAFTFGISHGDVLLRSLFLFIPISALLLILTSIVFQKQKVLHSHFQLINNIGADKALNLKDRLSHMIEENKWEESFSLLKANFRAEDIDLNNQLTQLKARWHDLQSQIQDGIINLDNQEIQKNRIRKSLLTLADEWEENQEFSD